MDEEDEWTADGEPQPSEAAAWAVAQHSVEVRLWNDAHEWVWTRWEYDAEAGRWERSAGVV